VLCQTRIDVIYLKNGDILKGEIIENVPNDYVKIELPGGSFFTVKYSDVLKFTKETPTNSLQAQPQNRQRTEASGSENLEKMMYYERDKKNSGTAVLLSLVITSAGHAYAGNWGRGLSFTAGRIAGAVLAITAGIQTNTQSTYVGSGRYYTSETVEITSWYYIGIASTLVFSIWEAIDASAEVDRYNASMYNRIMGKKPFSLNVVPTKNGPQVQLSYCF
jgi:hypothetical protein